VITITVRRSQGRQVTTGVDRFPDTCPICHRAITPIDLGYDYMIGDDNHTAKVERTFRCPDAKCERTFVARYERTSITNQTHFELRTCVPAELFDLVCSEIIAKISPDYCQIYNQAHKAEQYNLETIAGPGYRKALEFLIKDYVSMLHPKPEDKEKIKTMLLGNCIATYVKNERINATAARAAWLGNDETHFVRKWEDKDLKDLKNLIGLSVRWIEMEQMTDEAIRDMPAGKK
jgi:hypothetical protein